MDTTVIQNNLWIELFKLAIFAVFVTSIIEVVKGISAKSILGIFKDIWYTLKDNTPICKESVLVINFTIALLCCWSFDYGVISKLIEPGIHLRQSFAGWVDYIGTASLIYTGADAMFVKFSAMKKSWEVNK